MKSNKKIEGTKQIKLVRVKIQVTMKKMERGKEKAGQRGDKVMLPIKMEQMLHQERTNIKFLKLI